MWLSAFRTSFLVYSTIIYVPDHCHVFGLCWEQVVDACIRLCATHGVPCPTADALLAIGYVCKVASVLDGHDKIHTSHNAESQYHFCFCIALLCNCVHIQLWAGLGLEHVEYFCAKLGLAIAFKSCSSIFLGRCTYMVSGFNE